MIVKIFTSFVAFCFLNSVLLTQTYALEQQNTILFNNETVETIESYLEEFVSILKPFEDEEQLNSQKIENMISEMQLLTSDLDETSKHLTDQLSEDQENLCTIIKWVAIFWLLIGIKVIMSFLKTYLKFTLKPPITIKGTIKMMRKLIRKSITVVIIVPIAIINFVLTSAQYINCKRA